MKLAARTLNCANDFGTPPTPRNFELLYTYVAGLKDDLNAAIAETMAEKGRINAADAEGLHRAHVSEDKLADKIEDVGRKMSGEIGDVLQLLKCASQATDSYGGSLDKGDRQLKEMTCAPDVQGVLLSLKDATKEMSETNHELRNNLSHSQMQIEELKHCLELARSESSVDPLTNLANRRRFDRVLEDAIEDAESAGQALCLLLIDIDHFKKFNDTFGHQTGDAVLRIVAHTIRTSVKGQDLAARYGGEEFAVILPNTALKDATVVAEQIRKAVSAKQLVRKSSGESLGRLTVSIGVSAYRTSESPHALINRADTYLYSAKRGGRDQVKCELTAGVCRNSDAA
ncbi:MAG: GGDEF domain-containing protein [Methyloligellaceae bacterium]